MSGPETPPPDDFPEERVRELAAQLSAAIGGRWIMSLGFARRHPTADGRTLTAVICDTDSSVPLAATALAMAEVAETATEGCECAGCQAIRDGVAALRDAVIRKQSGALH